MRGSWPLAWSSVASGWRHAAAVYNLGLIARFWEVETSDSCRCNSGDGSQVCDREGNDGTHEENPHSGFIRGAPWLRAFRQEGRRSGGSSDRRSSEAGPGPANADQRAEESAGQLRANADQRAEESDRDAANTVDRPPDPVQWCCHVEASTCSCAARCRARRCAAARRYARICAARCCACCGHPEMKSPRRRYIPSRRAPSRPPLRRAFGVAARIVQ